jgi:hypothetical protein
MIKYLIMVTISMATALLLIGCKQHSHRTETSQGQGLVGAWQAEITFSSGSIASIKDLEFMYVFNMGGTMTESSNYDAAPPVPPAYGVWRKIDNRLFEAKYGFYITRMPDSSEGSVGNTGWPPAGRGVFTDTITISEDGQTFTSKIHYEACDHSGKTLQSEEEATAKGIRVNF